MRIILFVCISILVIFSVYAFPLNQSPKHAQLIDKIMKEFCQDLGKRHQLIMYGSGGGFLGNVNMVALDFKTIGSKSEEELRELLVEITEDFLERINSNQEIRKYLVEYPFPAKNLEFRITLLETQKKPIKNKADKNDLLADVSLFKGKVRYQFENEVKPNIQTRYTESYEEALQIVQKSRPDLFQQKR